MFYNTHTHRRPQSSDEFCIRNSFLHSLEKFHSKYHLSSGLHPWFVHQYNVGEMRRILEKNIQDPRILAVGEIGLDKLRPNYNLQKEMLNAQMVIASDSNLPLIVHQVKSGSDLIPYLNQFPGFIVLHGYTQHLSVWEQLNRHNKTFISIGSAAIQPSKKLRDVIKNIPFEKLFLETDNAHIRIEEVYQSIAQIRSVSLEGLVLQMEQNFHRVFLSRI